MGRSVYRTDGVSEQRHQVGSTEGESVHHRLGLCPGSLRAHLWGNPMQSRDQRDLLLSPCQLVPRTQPFTSLFIM